MLNGFADDGRAGLDHPDSARWPTYLKQMLFLQYRHWLPDDILTKFDKMTMANSIEGRVPFLDHRFVRYVNGLPDNARIRGEMLPGECSWVSFALEGDHYDNLHRQARRLHADP